jgi:FtsP/CotA-like multicopper oxidase with cupredoxin domain/peroxiredoxin
VVYQLSNGLAGALIVEGGPGDALFDLEDVPEVAAAQERILVFQLYNHRNCPDGVARIDTSTIYNVTPEAYDCKAITLSGDPPDPANAPQATAINGVINPVIVLAPGEVQRRRMIHAAWDVKRNLTFFTDGDDPADDLFFHEIALDGLATGNLVKKMMIEIAPGQRSDVLVRAPLLGPGERERIYHLRQDNVPGPKAPHGRPQDPLYLAKVVVRGAPRTMRLPDPAALARCQPCAPGAVEELSPMPTFPGGLVFSATDGDPVDAKNKPPHYTINGKAYDENRVYQIRLGTAEEWTVAAEVVDGKSSHPFHIHVNPFQVVLHKDARGNVTPRNEWWDTLYIPEGESFVIRSRFRDFTGKAILHCHILDHEDQGMMMPIEFIPPYQAPVPPGAPARAKLEPVRNPAPALRLPEAGGPSARDLSEFRGKAVVLVFIQGAECAHCVERLRHLIGAARGTVWPDAEIVAVSGRRVGDARRVLGMLGVVPSDRFRLLLDETHAAFRAFGCYGVGPEHGLFLIDGAGVIRARYSGEVPFGDTWEVLRLVRELAPAGDEPASR